MNVTRFEPWSLVDLLHQDLNQIAGRRYGLASDDNNGSSVADWVPAVDIVEEKDRYVLRADVPGVKPEDIDVNMESGVLTVSGARRHESTEEAEGMRRVERVHGKFYRRFNLPDTADAEEISAKSANGILEVSIPKQPEVQARRITVESA
jgi:HSP20 family protein